MLYFDHNSTTPVDSRVADLLDRVNREIFGNPSSIHLAGQSARRNLENARRSIARGLGADPSEIVFTSGGTESNNLALRGRTHVVTTAIEHPAVLEPLCSANVTRVPVLPSGVVNPDDILAAITPETGLISVMLANNETGAIQPVHQLAKQTRARGILLHSDGVQAVGKIPVNLHELGVDLFSISGHKLYAPKGIGILYVRKGVPLNPLHLGGRHERGLRAGTENVAGAMALDFALTLCSPTEHQHLAHLRDEFESRLLRELPDSSVNAIAAPRLPNTSNILFPAISGEALLIALDMRGICVSTGSACSSGSTEPSHVLLEMGLSPKQARACIRFSFGRQNTLEDVATLVAAVTQCVSRLRSTTREQQLV